MKIIYIKLAFILYLGIILSNNFLIKESQEYKYYSFKNSNHSKNYSVLIDPYKEMEDIQNYVDIIFNNILIDKGKNFYFNNCPKISIVITVYNGEAFLEKALLSIQNQDFKDLEIIMIDDHSIDNSVNLIKDFMKIEPRIKLFQNSENRGMLFTKTKGILLSNGKYILLLDEDDIFIQRNAFTILYNEAEKYDLDILNFGLLMSKPKLEINKNLRNRVEYPIIYNNEIRKTMFSNNSKGEVTFINGLLTNRFIKRSILIKAINQINPKLLNEKMNFHDDYVLNFLITRIAHKYKKIDRFFYMVLCGWDAKNKKVQLRNNEKLKNRKRMRCNSLLNFIEFILEKTENNINDKKIAFYSFNKWFLNYWCRNFSETIVKAINISNKYLGNKYIQEEDKKQIRNFLNESRVSFKGNR